MSKFESDIKKKLKKIHDEAATKVRKLLKSKKALLIYNVHWDQPGHIEFRKFGPEVGDYLIYCGLIENPDTIDIDDLVDDPMAFSFATREELDEFKVKTWPKLYGKWLEGEKKRKAENREANAKDAKKIRAKIAKLQKQLEEVED